MLKELLCLRLSVLLSIVYIVSCPRKTRFVCARARVCVSACVCLVHLSIHCFLFDFKLFHNTHTTTFLLFEMANKLFSFVY